MAPILTPAELDYSIFSKAKNQRAPRGNPHGRKKQKYKNLVCAFDIETSTLPDMEQAVMYIWQFQVDDICKQTTLCNWKDSKFQSHSAAPL